MFSIYPKHVLKHSVIIVELNWWSQKNLHHAEGGQYWFLPQHINELIHWVIGNAGAQTNSPSSIAKHRRSVLTDCCCRGRPLANTSETQARIPARGAHSYSSRSRAAWRLFIDGVMELTWRNPLYTRVDLSQDVAWQPRTRPTSHVTLDASQWEDLTVHICGCVCVGDDVGGGSWGCNKATHICRLHEPQPCRVCNPKPGQWLYSLPTSTDSILIYDSNEYRFSRSYTPLCAHTSSHPFHFSF